MKRNWFDVKVLILGFSGSGIAAAKYLAQKGADCFITETKDTADKNKDKIEELKKLGIKMEFGAHSDEFLNDTNLAITSPGIPPHSEIFQRLREKNIPVISEIELAYRETGAPFIAITGTNGKTTTTLLTSFILEKELKAPVCGNIGIPPCSILDKSNNYYVCEVSSFQAEFSKGFRPQIAVWMNFTPDHIDWHNGLENYFNAKASLFSSSKFPAFAIFNALDEKVLEFGEKYNGEKFFFGKEFEKNCCYIKNNAIYFKRKTEEKIIDIDNIPLVGEHNYQNVMASIISAKIVGIDNQNIIDAIKEFKAPEHRCEFVTEINGQKAYNDSKATNPEAAIFALTSFEGKTVSLIAGGRDKNTDLTEFCETIKKCVNNVILIGEAKDRFDKELRKNKYEKIIYADTFQESIDKAFKTGDEIILLSPACASFDMFNSYEERGKAFKDYVKSKK